MKKITILAFLLLALPSMGEPKKVPDALAARLYKAHAQSLQAQLALEHTKEWQAMLQAQDAENKAQQEWKALCGKQQPGQDAQGEPVCADMQDDSGQKVR
jgi:hypothetical protein